MDLKLLCSSVKEACENSPVLAGVALLAFCIAIYLIVDAQRTKKKRPRHRCKEHK